MEYSFPDYQGGNRRLQGDWSVGGTVEDSYQPPEPPTHNRHQASRCAAWVPGGPGVGTAALKAKLIQQLMAMREAVLFEVFLDL